jgi:hypothetical protein
MILAGCQLDRQDHDNIVIGIKEDIILEMRQILSPSGTGLHFLLQSITPYSCDGAGFQHTTKTSQGQIDIQLFQVDIPVPCQGGHAAAQEFIPLPAYSGSYSLSIGFGTLIENKGELTIDQHGYKLSMESKPIAKSVAR